MSDKYGVRWDLSRYALVAISEVRADANLAFAANSHPEDRFLDPRNYPPLSKDEFMRLGLVYDVAVIETNGQAYGYCVSILSSRTVAIPYIFGA